MGTLQKYAYFFSIFSPLNLDLLKFPQIVHRSHSFGEIQTLKRKDLIMKGTRNISPMQNYGVLVHPRIQVEPIQSWRTCLFIRASNLSSERAHTIQDGRPRSSMLKVFQRGKASWGSSINHVVTFLTPLRGHFY